MSGLMNVIRRLLGRPPAPALDERLLVAVAQLTLAVEHLVTYAERIERVVQAVNGKLDSLALALVDGEVVAVEDLRDAEAALEREGGPAPPAWLVERIVDGSVRPVLASPPAETIRAALDQARQALEVDG